MADCGLDISLRIVFSMPPKAVCVLGALAPSADCNQTRSSLGAANSETTGGVPNSSVFRGDVVIKGIPVSERLRRRRVWNPSSPLRFGLTYLLEPAGPIDPLP
jgi:hypothetical protein